MDSIVNHLFGFQDSLFKSKWDSDPKEDRLGKCFLTYKFLQEWEFILLS